MSKFTPGPWLARQFPTGRGAVHGWWVIDSIPDQDGRIVANAICQVSTTNDDADANAKLLAAAPELLKALQGILDNFKQNQGVGLGIGPISKAKAAIAKATGK